MSHGGHQHGGALRSLDAAIANTGGASADHFRTGGAGVIDGGDPLLWAPMVLANVLGPALLAKAALPHLEQSRGRLVLIGSVAGIKNSPGNLYSATKWAVVGFAENLRLHATTRGIGVTVVNPGIIDTAFWHGQAPPHRDEPGCGGRGDRLRARPTDRRRPQHGDDPSDRPTRLTPRGQRAHW